MRVKAFGKDIPEIQGKDFSGFDALNNVIERDNISPDDVIEAYHKVLLGTLSPTEKADIHWQIQYLFDEVKIPVNRILDFVDVKFSSFERVFDLMVQRTRFCNRSELKELKNAVCNLNVSGNIEMVMINLETGKQGTSYCLYLNKMDSPEERIRKTEEILNQLGQDLQVGNGLLLKGFLVEGK